MNLYRMRWLMNRNVFATIGLEAIDLKTIMDMMNTKMPRNMGALFLSILAINRLEDYQ